MMKRNSWIRVVGITILVISLTACGKSSTDNNTINQDPPAEQTPDHSNDNNDINNEEIDDEENVNNEPEDSPSNTIEINENNSVTALVNKHNSLGEAYVPSDLVTVEVPTVLENPEVKQLRKVAADALYEMFSHAKESDVYLHARSGYRSYQTQAQLFENYTSQHGEEAANRYSARPGQSEHQTGLVMDVTSDSVHLQLEDTFGETNEGKWISEHAHEFGFIVRYPKDMEHVTGYIYEPWHIRYLGIDVATEVFESGLTYEEYLVGEGIIHEVNAKANE